MRQPRWLQRVRLAAPFQDDEAAAGDLLRVTPILSRESLGLASKVLNLIAQLHALVPLALRIWIGNRFYRAYCRYDIIIFFAKVCPRNRVQGLILRHDVPVMQSPLKPLIDPNNWTKTGTIGTESSYMSHVPSFDAISRGSTNSRTWLRRCVENGDTRPQPPKGVGRSVTS